MKIETKTQIMAPGRHLPFEVVSLVLQGGGALGAYRRDDRHAASQKPKRHLVSGLGWPIRHVDRGRDWRNRAGRMNGKKIPPASIQPAWQQRGLS
jgi:hypothetical protein